MPFVDAVARITQIQENLTLMSTKPASTATAAAFAAEVAAVTPAAEVATGSPASVTGQSIVDAARKYEGVPYVFGGADRSGMDCSGLVQRTLKDLGIDAPRLAHEQATLGTEVGSLANAKPGDLIVTKNADHIVIYAGDGMVVHAPYEGRNVSYQKNWLTDADIMTIRRIAPSGATAPAASTSSLTSTQIASSTASARSNLISGGVKSGGTANSLLALIPGAAS